MATVFERLRTIALAAQTSSMNYDNFSELRVIRSHSLVLPEKQTRMKLPLTHKNDAPQWIEEELPMIYENSLSKDPLNRQQLMAKHPKSNRDECLSRPRIIKKLPLSRLDKSFIRTVDDFVVNARSHVAPMFLARQDENISHQGSSENFSRFSGDSSSEESTPPSSTRLGIGPAPCFLVNQSTDEERGESDREVPQHINYWLPSSIRSLEIIHKEEEANLPERIGPALSLRGSFIISGQNQIEDEESPQEGLQVDRVSSMVANYGELEIIRSKPISRTQSAPENTYMRSPKARGMNEEFYTPRQSSLDWNDKKTDSGVWSESGVIITCFGDEKRESISKSEDLQEKNIAQSVSADLSSTNQQSTTQNTWLAARTPRIGKCPEEMAPLALESFLTEEDTKSCVSESSYMFSLFNNPDWVKAEDLCPITSLGSLGRGSGGGVTGVFHIPTCNIFALKATTHYSEVEHFVILKEALKDRRTPQLMKLFGLFEDINSNEKALVLKYMDLGSLHDHFISKGKRCTEKQVRHIARETLLGLQQLHSFETPIIHRDIKPHNILIESVGTIRVADYGLLYSLRDKKQLCTDMAGTSKYFSPERHNGKFSMPSDIWALGVTLLECFLGKMLDAKDLEDVKVAGGQVHPLDFHDQSEIRLSVDALNFLQCCLRFDSSKRWNATKLLQHQFLKPPYPEPSGIFVPKRKIEANEKLLKEILEIIQTFILRNLQKKVSQEDIWANVKGITHETRLSNIVHWTGFAKAEIEEYVMQLYNERTNPRSRF